MIPQVAYGAIAASLIGGVVSLLGLVVSKEQKVSDFRQAWVDSLRQELTIYLAHINAIVDINGIAFDNFEEKVKSLSPHYLKMNEAIFSVNLRLNRDESTSKDVLSSMASISNVFSNSNGINVAEVKKFEKELIVSSQKLLKIEWNRVKSGEKTFKIAKFLAVAVILGSFLVGITMVINNYAVSKISGPSRIGTEAKTVQPGNSRPQQKPTT